MTWMQWIAVVGFGWLAVATVVACWLGPRLRRNSDGYPAAVNVLPDRREQR